SALIIGSGPTPEKAITVNTAPSIFVKVKMVVMASLFQVFFMKGMAVAMRMTASAYNRPAAIKWPVRKLTRYSMGIVVAPFDGTGTKKHKNSDHAEQDKLGFN
ncbi:hypothetical protein NE556_23270, partial [[Clostridium] symbiosum]|uniref:hypothetical protein n=1 Tax=Clostridium symbiosum TaxID=1512 RepID=UPI002109E16C